MIFQELPLGGAYVLNIEPHRDERGFFARSFCVEELSAHGLETGIVQTSISYNAKKGTLRGMHFQAEPYGEVKLIRCTRGAIFDVIVDIRPDSPSYGRWTALELSENNRRQLYVPRGFAHGFQSLADDTEVFYQINREYRPEAAGGFRWDDPAVRIEWPETPSRIISTRDANLPMLAELRLGG